MFKDVSGQGRRFEHHVRECSQSNHRLRGVSEDWEWMWICSQLASGSLMVAHNFYQLFTGKTVDKSGFRKRLKRVDSLAEEFFR